MTIIAAHSVELAGSLSSSSSNELPQAGLSLECGIGRCGGCQVRVGKWDREGGGRILELCRELWLGLGGMVGSVNRAQGMASATNIGWKSGLLKPQTTGPKWQQHEDPN
ncbi:hypothetical protein CVT26_009962 [Gymnopilus dilepis]|uniref:2Fe-2S ferredoxin-type domain-containing protein n=1 Tax=Gymnopilus dilepis TaxID=231916 RepID=A0A409VL60_9AGAR|nr:hypothetical protein CVT26_009962 [Gymnopilus dilepis]